MKRSLRSWLWRVPIDQEVDEELALHLELRTRELTERGMDPKTARDMAASRLGDVRQVKRTLVHIARTRDREMRLTQWVEEFRNDVRFALRQLRRSPAFTLVASITLALGVGANSAMFALADATLLRPLPYPAPDRLVSVRETTGDAPRAPMSPLDLRDLSEQNRTFDSMAAISLGAGGGPLLTAPDGTVESAERQAVTAAFFDVLGVAPVAGRTFRSVDEGQRPTVVVLGEGLWRRRFGGDAGIIGRDVRLNGQPFTVVGVVPDAVQFTRPARIWTLLPQFDAAAVPRGARFLEVVGRLRPGVTLEAAQTDLAVIAARLARDYPDTNKGWGVMVEPLRDGLMGRDLQLTALFLLGVVGSVLLLCCANVANLLLARASSRVRELAVRSALGAGRARIVAQLLTESLVLAAIGGAIGIALGAAILEAAPALIPPGLLPPVVILTFDGRVALFGAVTAFAVGVLFGLVPAWQATGGSLARAMDSGGRSATASGGWLRNLLVTGEVAAAVLLLCGAGLLLRTMLVLVGADTGYRAASDSVLTLDFSLLDSPAARARYSTGESLLQFYDTIAREVTALPEVRSAGWSSSLPYGTSELGQWAFGVVGATPVEASRRPTADYAAVSNGYFRTLNLPIVSGRVFDERDTASSTQVTIVNEAFARRYLQGRDPIGARILFQRDRQSDTLVREVVGIARQVPGQPDAPEEMLQAYVPLAQHPAGDVFLVVQASTGRAEALTPLVRAVVARHDANTSVRRDRTLEFLSVSATAGYRFRATIVATFAGLALLLAMVGVFGVLAYSVQQRSREFGVRIALGATTSHVIGLVLGSAARMITIGTVIGLAAAALLARSISAFLFGVQPLDPVTFASVGAVLALTAALATATPAWRAACSDPVAAFRHE